MYIYILDSAKIKLVWSWRISDRNVHFQCLYFISQTEKLSNILKIF